MQPQSNPLALPLLETASVPGINPITHLVPSKKHAFHQGNQCCTELLEGHDPKRMQQLCQNPVLVNSILFAEPRLVETSLVTECHGKLTIWGGT